VIAHSEAGINPHGMVFISTITKDHTAKDISCTSPVNLWRRNKFFNSEFDASRDFYFCPIDPAVDETKVKLIYDKILELLGEPKLH
jgi:hypothetical protein